MQMSTERFDTLTGLPNITYFRDLSQKILNDPAALEKGLVFIYFDIKNFRAFNYRYGFDAGDKLLIHAGNVIKNFFPEFGVSRFADDKFITLAYDEDVEKRIKSARNKVANFQNMATIAIKAGIFNVPKTPGTNFVHACDCAKLACESIKKIVGSILGYYNEEIGRRERLREHIIESIDEATKNEYIQVFYQPIVHVVSRRVCGYEALARWNDPKFGFLSPPDFIGVLEDSRLIHRLDIYMIRKICSDMKKCLDAGRAIVPVSMNLSALDFQMVNMPFIASDALRADNLPKNFLNVEITESALGDGHKDIYETLDRFRRNGFEIWLDNFGSKYSSLNVLEEVDVDLLKIDMRFLRKFHTETRSRSILKNIMNMAKELGIHTLMEGVEDEEVLEFLRQTGCEKAQGWLFGKPMPFDKTEFFGHDTEESHERDYYDAIGRVNLLSQTPFKTGQTAKSSSDDAPEIVREENKAAGKFTDPATIDFMLNGLPLAIAEFDGKKFKFLMSNKIFRDIFKKMAVGEKDSPDDVFNNFSLQFTIKIHSLAQQCIKNGSEGTADFVTGEGFNKIRLRCIAYNKHKKTGALLAVVEQFGGNTEMKKERRRDIALRFLYMLYSRIDIIKADGSSIENIYLNSSRYREGFLKDSAEKSVANFAELNIYSEDREKFKEFFDLATIEQRLAEVGGSHVTDYFRTRDDRHNYTWQMYILVPMIHNGEKYFLSCARSIEAERMRRLPEIDKMGTEYYDMPGNPIFLLLAGRAFTSTLGYGSFNQFLNNSLYIEANLSANRILYIHLGKQGVVSNLNHTTTTYGETVQDMILNTVVASDHNRIEKFFSRGRLIVDYKGGKGNGETEFLRRPDPETKPRWLHTIYQTRESAETGDIHAYFLAFDIDAYRRTNESMIELIERDNLTGLYNRGTVVSLIHKYLANEASKSAAFIILDLDNFKQINDRYGHDCGDMIIKDAARRMKETFQDYGIVSRIGGDEFLVMLKALKDDEVSEILQHFSDTEKFVEYYGRKVNFTMSIGYSLYPEHGKEYRVLYQNADTALYTVKMAGRNSFRKFSPKMVVTGTRDQLGFSLTQISEGMPGGFLVYRDDEKQEILYANKRLIQIYECENLEEFRKFTGNSFKGCVLEEEWEYVQNTIATQVEISEGYDYVRYRARTAKGNIIAVEDFGRLVESPEEGNMFYVFIIDIEKKERIYRNHVLGFV